MPLMDRFSDISKAKVCDASHSVLACAQARKQKAPLQAEHAAQHRVVLQD